jgi:hypothetical protein
MKRRAHEILAPSSSRDDLGSTSDYIDELELEAATLSDFGFVFDLDDAREELLACRRGISE